MVPFTHLKQIPRGVWALGFVSLFMDFSSEMIHAILPVYLVTVLGASTLTVGFIEGTAEAIASITKVFSGFLSDWLGRRKLLAVIGYGLAAITKPVFALAGSLGPIVGARFVDRTGKGIRGAPRDALVGEITPEHLRGAGYGLRQSLDTMGAVLGPLAALGLMFITHNRFRVIFWVAVIPAVVSVMILLLGVREHEQKHVIRPRGPIQLARWKQTDAAYWILLGITFVLTLARFSEAFLLLRAEEVGLHLSLIPSVLVIMNMVYAFSSYPAGRMSDRIGRHGMVSVGIAFLIASELVLGFGPSMWWVVSGIVFWGLHMGFTQGVLAAMVADVADPELRASAFGVFNLVSGVAMLFASVLAGFLWDSYGSQTTFMTGAGCAILSLLGLLVWDNRRTRS